MIEEQLYAQWLVPHAIAKLQAGNFQIRYGSIQKEDFLNFISGPVMSWEKERDEKKNLLP